MRSIAAAITLSSLASSLASASITYKSVGCELGWTAWAGLGDADGGHFSASGPGAHFGGGDADSSWQDPGFPGPNTAHSEAHVEYNAFASIFSGSGKGFIVNVPMGSPTLSAVDLHLQANFIVSEATSFFAKVAGSSEFRMAGVTPGPPNDISIDLTAGEVSGVLPPGEYVMDCRIFLSSFDFVPGGSADVSFLIPAPTACGIFGIAFARTACRRSREQPRARLATNLPDFRE